MDIVSEVHSSVDEKPSGLTRDTENSGNIEHELAKSLIPGDLVFDVGANIGDKAASLVSRGVRVVCVEPQPACVAVLEDRFGHDTDITIVPKGLGSRPGLLEMFVNSSAPVLSTFSPQWMTGRFAHETWDQRIDVPITTLDDLVREYGIPRYIKIDVEGFEYEVICGLSRRLGVISFEFTDEFFANAERMLRYLENLGYSKFNFSLGEQKVFFLQRWDSAAQLRAALRSLFAVYRGLWGDIYAN